MKATALLEKQHREVKELFKAFEKAKGPAAKTAVFERIAKALVAHDAIEREIFYPACEKKFESEDAEDTLEESLVEHGLVEFSIFRADKNKGTDRLEAYVTVLQEVVEHHVDEEEKDLLPKASKALGSEALEELGAAMEKRYAAAHAADFRRPLRDNLQQVLAGKMKTAKKKSSSRPKKKTRALAKK